MKKYTLKAAQGGFSVGKAKILKNNASQANIVYSSIKELVRSMKHKEVEKLSEPVILVADELRPSNLTGCDTSMLRGTISAKGNAASHASIVACGLGIPCLFGNEKIVRSLHDEDRLVIDGENLYVNPREKEWILAQERYEFEQKTLREQVAKDKEKIAQIKTKTRIFANVGQIDEARAVVDSCAEGIGLFRTELLFLSIKTAPTEEEQFMAYRAMVEAMGGREVIIRTMDVGSDKKVPWLKLPEEKNPALGYRGVRISLGYPEVFKTQMRAVMRASVYGSVKLMTPMISSTWEVEETRRIMEECASELTEEGVTFAKPELGVMIETPAAAVLADEFASKVAFISIGSNDLTQYTLAIDREAQGLEVHYDAFHESVFRLIENIVNAAHANGIPVGICGELAGNPAAIERLISIGVDELSVSVSKLVRTKLLAAEAEESLGIS